MSGDSLKLDSDALASFTSQLNDLIRDTSATLFPDSFHGEIGDPGVEAAIADMAATDLLIGQRLNAYLSALASLTAAASKATRDLDHELATKVPEHENGRMKELY